jgi:hypothetical protein
MCSEVFLTKWLNDGLPDYMVIQFAKELKRVQKESTYVGPHPKDFQLPEVVGPKRKTHKGLPG